MNKVLSTVNHIVTRSAELKNTFTSELTAPVEFACIFCHNEEEYQKFTSTIKILGKVVESTPGGYTYLLNEPIATVSGPLRLVKIRKPNPQLLGRGDADFNSDYENFRKIYQGDPKFEFVKRETFEMLRLSDPGFDVMACFSSIPKSKELGIKF